MSQHSGSAFEAIDPLRGRLSRPTLDILGSLTRFQREMNMNMFDYLSEGKLMMEDVNAVLSYVAYAFVAKKARLPWRR